jgi:hypothetical protein
MLNGGKLLGDDKGNEIRRYRAALECDIEQASHRRRNNSAGRGANGFRDQSFADKPEAWMNFRS